MSSEVLLEGGDVAPASPESVPQRVCCICLEDIAVPLLVLASAQGCRHDPSLCRPCASQHVRSRVLDKKGATLRCPCQGCGAEISAEDVTRLTSARLQAEYDRLRTLEFVRTLPNFCWCSRPGCGSGQEHITGHEEPIMTCHACRHRTCFTHRSEWHDGITCEEFSAQLAQVGGTDCSASPGTLT